MRLVLTLVGCLAVTFPRFASGLEAMETGAPVTQEDPDDHWIAFGSSDEAGLNSGVSALVSYRGDLIAAGVFTVSGGQRFKKIARWDGAAWHSLRGGVDNFPCPGLECIGRVGALAVDDTSLFVGGWFPSVDGGMPARYVARWDGERWYPLGLGVDNLVTALTEYDGDLIAGGDFTEAGGLPASRIARWDGSTWHALGDGFDSTVLSLIVYRGELIASGLLRYSGDVPVNYIARWDGDSWSSLGGGFTEPTNGRLAIFQEELVTRGSFVSETAQQTRGAVVWNGSGWRPLGPAHTGVIWFVGYNGRLIAAGNVPELNHVVEWTGTEWRSLGSGVGTGLYETPTALTVHGQSLFVGGDFTMAGGKVSHHIARWDDVITPVGIEAFQATVSGSSIELSWRLGVWWEIQKVAVERAEALEGPYRVLANLVPQESMSYTDIETFADREYWFRLVLAQGNGGYLVSSPLHVRSFESFETILLPPRVSQDRIIVSYRIGQPGLPIALGVFNVRGQLVQSLDMGVRDRGEYVRFWDGRTAMGTSVPRGVYLVRLQAGRVTTSHKVVITRH